MGCRKQNCNALSLQEADEPNAPKTPILHSANAFSLKAHSHIGIMRWQLHEPRATKSYAANQIA